MRIDWRTAAFGRYGHVCQTSRDFNEIKDRGRTVCAGVLAPRTAVDTRLLAELRDELLSPEVLSNIQQQVTRIIAERQREAARAVDTRQARLAEVEREIEPLVDAIAAVGISDALSEAGRRPAKRVSAGLGKSPHDTTRFDWANPPR